MAIDKFEDLVCWRLAHALECEVIAFTSSGPASRDFKYRDQIRESSASSPANIAEAFGRFRPKDAVRFCDYALGSLRETRNHLISGRARGYLSDALFSRLSHLSEKAFEATKNWKLSLKRRHGLT